MQVTDEMVDAARNIINDPRMRAALEAALGARRGNASELINSLIGWANVLEISSGKFVNEDCRKAAACIEDLAAALNYMIQTQEAWEEDVSKIIQRPPNIFNRAIDYARATLEKWGLK